MPHRKLKLGYLTLEGLNAFATGYYFTYLFFYLASAFHFSTLAAASRPGRCSYLPISGQQWPRLEAVTYV